MQDFDGTIAYKNISIKKNNRCVRIKYCETKLIKNRSNVVKNISHSFTQVNIFNIQI